MILLTEAQWAARFVMEGIYSTWWAVLLLCVVFAIFMMYFMGGVFRLFKIGAYSEENMRKEKMLIDYLNSRDKKRK